MKERLYSVYCVDYDRKALTPALISEEELGRIVDHNGIEQTPGPIQLTFLTEQRENGEEITMKIDDLWVEFISNKKLYR